MTGDEIALMVVAFLTGALLTSLVTIATTVNYTKVNSEKPFEVYGASYKCMKITAGEK